MKTALITIADKQQIVLQPEDLREHRILQMLTRDPSHIQVLESWFSISAIGQLVKFEGPTYHTQEKITPLLIQVQPPAPVIPDPDVVTLSRKDLLMMMREYRLKEGTAAPSNKQQDDDLQRMSGGDAEWFIAHLEQHRKERDPQMPHPYR